MGAGGFMAQDKEAAAQDGVPAEDVESFVASLERPRRIILMVQAGPALLPGNHQPGIPEGGEEAQDMAQLRPRERGVPPPRVEEGAERTVANVPDASPEVELRIAQAKVEHRPSLRQVDAARVDGPASAAGRARTHGSARDGT